LFAYFEKSSQAGQTFRQRKRGAKRIEVQSYNQPL
jgi:hypothetical protein